MPGFPNSTNQRRGLLGLLARLVGLVALLARLARVLSLLAGLLILATLLLARLLIRAALVLLLGLLIALVLIAHWKSPHRMSSTVDPTQVAIEAGIASAIFYRMPLAHPVPDH